MQSLPTHFFRRALFSALVAGLCCSISNARASIVPGPLVGADSPILDARLHDTLLGAGIRPALREDLQRPVDSRLLRIETLGLEACGLFKGRRHEARNAAEVEALSTKLKPGDQLILTGAEWKDATFVFAGEGTAEAPILIGATSAGAITFTGASSATFHGRHLVIMNLVFRNGLITEKTRDILRLGHGKERPADHCIVNRVTIDNVNSTDPANWTKVLAHYVSINGHSCTVANSTFTHLKNYGEVISTSATPTDIPQRLHILNNRFIDRPRVDQETTPYRFKIIQVGGSGLKAAPSGSLIQGNLFEDCASFVELISIKASDVFFRNNRLIRCEGAVNIRMGDRALIQDNFIDGENQPGTGGLRVAGRDNVIIGNTFKRLRPTKDNYMWPPPKDPTPYLTWTLAVVMADHEYSGFEGDTYGRSQNILVAHNRFEGNAGRIAMGSPTPTLSSVRLAPRNIWIEHNVFAGDGKGDKLFDYLAKDLSEILTDAVFTYDNQFLP